MLRTYFRRYIILGAFKQYLTASGYGSAKIKHFNEAVNFVSEQNFDFYFDTGSTNLATDLYISLDLRKGF